MMTKKWVSNRLAGFTIVELLIVIVIIAILAAITVVAYNGIQDRSRTSKVNADLNALVKAVHMARINDGKVLKDITNNGCTRCSCPYASGDLTAYNTLPKTNNCWVVYSTTLDRIAASSGADLSSLKNGDPWGSPYMIDENELENGTCNRDTVWSAGKSANTNGGTQVGSVAIPLSTPPCI